MKKFNFLAKLFLAACVMSVFNACEQEPQDPTQSTNPNPDQGTPTVGECYKITFDALPEGVVLNANGVWDGSAGEGGFSMDSIWFNNVYNAGGWSDGGFNISNNVDMQTAGFQNQYSVYNASGANGSQNFAVVYYSAFASEDGSNSGFKFEKTPSHVKSVKVNNSTYTYLTLKNGDGFTQPMSDGGWFKVIFTGALDGKTTSSVEFFLADFRDGKTFICSEWTEVNLTTLGVVDQVKITFDSSDKGDYGLNTPTYVCIDDVEIEGKIVKENANVETITLDLANLDETFTFDENNVWTGTYEGELEENSFTLQNMTFSHVGDVDMDFWEGWTIAKSSVTTFASYSTDQWNNVAGGGLAGVGTPYLVFYTGFGFHENSITFSTESTPKEVYFCQNSWAAKCITSGDGVARKFEQGDYLTIKVVGLDAEGNVIEDKEVVYYLADYRDADSSKWTLNEGWEKCNLSSLGKVHGLRFTMETTDMSNGYANTSTYFAMDGLKIEIEK